MSTYDIEVTRDGKWWMVAIPAIDGLTQARRLSEVENMAVAFISLDQDVAASEVDVRVTKFIVDGEDFSIRQIVLARARERVEEAQSALEAERLALMRELVADAVPLRDVAEVVGVSHQRVHQLLSA